MKSHVHAFSSEYRRLFGSTALPPEIAANYEIESCLHETADKAVFLVRGRADGKAYVLKIASRQSRENLAAEYALLSLLSHTSIPKAVSCSEADGAFYLVREYVPGKTLSALMDEEGPLPARKAADVVTRLCDVLAYLHHQNPPIIHRDVKPQNVLLADDGRCVLIDFGIARRFDGEAAQDTVCMGTQATAAPEQFGYRQTDVRSDVYSTGILLLYLTTGSFDPGAASAMPGRLGRIVRRCTRFDPADRYADILRVQRALTRFLHPARRLFTAGILAVGLLTTALLLPQTLLARPPASSPAVSAAPDATNAPTDTAAPADAAYQFASPLVEQAVRTQLGRDAGAPVTLADLDLITGLYICGTRVYETWDEHSYYSGADHFGGELEQSVGTVNTLADIASMHNLRELTLFNQEITDLSPLEGLPLVKLGLGGNRIADASPLAGLTGLTDLLLENNPLSDIQPLQTLSALQSLDLTGTNVSDISPLAGLPLSFLSLRSCPVRDCSPLTQLPQISRLIVSGLTPEQAAVCGELTTLVDLTIANCGITSLEPFQKLVRLSFIDLLDNELTSLSGVEIFTELKGLCFWGNPVSDLSPAASLKTLTYLNVGRTNVTNFDVFAELPTLEKIDCSLDQQEAVTTALRGRDVTIGAY